MRKAIENSQACRQRHAFMTQEDLVKDVATESEQLWGYGALVLGTQGQVDALYHRDISTYICAYLRFREDAPNIKFHDVFDVDDPDNRDRAKQAMAKAVRAVLPLPPTLSPEEQYAAAAFETDERTRASAVPSRWLADQVAAYEKQYKDDARLYNSPSTTFFAPSGAGKSFAVVRMATHNVYVVYCNLAPPRHGVIPERSALADAVDRVYTREHASQLWLRFGRLGIAMATEAQALQLPPSLFVAVQYKAEHYSTQSDLVALLDNPQCWRLAGRAKPTRALFDRVRTILTTVAHQHAAAYASTTSSSEANPSSPLIVFAFDDARSILRTVEDTNLFRLLRTALCGIWDAGRSKKLRVLALMIDTSSELNGFVPNCTHDPSAKRPRKVMLFPPIYQLQTWDVMHQNASLALQQGDVEDLLLHYTPDGSPAYWQYVLTLGSPLWGAVFRAYLHKGTPRSSPLPSSASTPSPDAISSANAVVFYLAFDKLSRRGQEPNRHHALALLSFQLGFDEIHQELGCHLVSDWLHFPVLINKSRSLMRTTQPSEPILALAAAAQHQDPTTRKEGIDALVAEYQTGAWHADIREIVGALLLLWATEVVWTADPQTIPTRPFNTVLTKLAGCVPENWPSVDAYDMHLTHMVRCRRDQPITANDIKLAFLTGQGWFPGRALPGVDIVVPLRNRDTHRIAVLVVQTTVREGDHSTDAASAFEAVYESLPLLHAVDVFGLYLALHPEPMSAVAHEDEDDRLSQDEPTPWHTIPSLDGQQSSLGSTQRTRSGSDGLRGSRRHQGRLYGAIRVGFNSSLYPVLRSTFDTAPFLASAVVASLTNLLKRGKFNVSEADAPYVASLLDRRDPTTCLPTAPSM